MGRRTHGCDLDDKVISYVLSGHVALAHCKPQELFRCGRGRDLWPAVHKNRRLISALLSVSGGRIPRQVQFHRQVRSWLLAQGIVWNLSDTETATFNFRQMLMQLQARRRARKSAPRAYQHLTGLIDKLHLSDDDVMQQIDEETIVMATPSEAWVDISSDEATPVDETTDAALEALESALFATPAKRKSPMMPTPEKEAKCAIVDVASLVAAAESLEAPLPRDYKAMKKGVKTVMRKPASATTETKDVDVTDDVDVVSFHKDAIIRGYLGLDIDRKTLLNRARSKFYHDEYDRCKALGMDPDDCKQRARLEGRSGVARLRALES